MSPKSSTWLNRVEVFFYSTLTACLSVANRFHSKEGYQADIAIPSSAPAVVLYPIDSQKTDGDPFIEAWNKIYQTIMPIIIWMVLGLAAGLLIGMIKPR